MRVKRARKEEFPRLGDLDGAGVHLVDRLATYLEGSSMVDEEGLKTLSCDSVTNDFDGDETDELFASFRTGESGVAALIEDDQGHEKARQRIADTARMRCGVLWVLERTQEQGWMALHSNAGRAVMGLLAPYLKDEFKTNFDDLRLQFNPFVDLEVLKQAVLAGHIRDIRLTKLARPSDAADAATNRWVPDGDVGKIEVIFHPARGRNKYLKAGPLRSFLQGTDQQQQTALQQIVEFEGTQFDEARVAVVLENGSERTYYVQREANGHPMAIDIDGQLAFDQYDNPTDESVRAALRGAIDSVL